MVGGRFPHAYIFHGPEGVGRERFARGLSKVLLCSTPKHVPTGETEGLVNWDRDVVDACHACDACRAVESGVHPDLHFIYRELIKDHPDPVVRARKGLGLGVDVVREFLIQRASNKPMLGKAKVFVVCEAETMKPPAQNALLKTLEEPPDSTYLILLATSADGLLATVRSRCQMVPFGLLPQEFIVGVLRRENDSVSEDDALLCATAAGGSLGAAMRHLADGLGDCNRRVAEVVSRLADRQASETAKRLIADAKVMGGAYQARDKEMSDTEAQRLGLRTLLSLLSLWYRDALHGSVGSNATAVNRSAGSVLNGFVDRVTATDAGEAIREIAVTEQRLSLNANVQLCVEALLIRLSRLMSC